MELLHAVMGAFETLPGPVVPVDALVREVARRGFSESDGAIGVEQALMQGVLLRDGPGGLRRPAEPAPAARPEGP
jgi:hypothetical protein